ncbi:Glutathione-regulated potassium-efflux system protein KefB [hydrothermal vent metagenome]|uniref:Glutathione-regulated potassium-efflux system protein KefB n=1 Tax=hydrothermal vent metagenome TaxID=652676 RepID=A0A1W1EE78_9ZZZZ
MLEIIVITIFIATITNLILTRLHIPTIIGYIATGIIITYFLQLNQSTNSKELNTIAEFGIVFLMFTIGLEFSIRNLIKMRKKVFMYGGLQVGLSMLVFYLLGHYIFNLDTRASLVVSAALALSSTAIVLKILNSNRDISKEYGQRSLGILIFQDIMVIPILLMITILSSVNLSMSQLLLKTVFDAFILFLALWGIGKYILEPFFTEVVKSNSNEIFIGSVLFIVIGASTLAHSLGFSYSLGAFIAGMIIAETKYKHQVEADLIPFRDLLLGLFFITVGMQIDFSIIGEYYITIFGLLTLFTIVKISIIFLILLKSAGKRVALKTSLALFQLGEFGLVIFELAKANELIAPTTSQILIVTITISMVITPFVLRNIASLTDLILEEETNNIEGQLKRQRHLQDHIIVLGYGRLGRKISEKLDKTSIKYIAIDNNIHNVKEGQIDGKNVIFGNAASKSILKSVNIEDATVVLVALDNSVKLHLVCDVLTQIATKARVIIKVERFMEKESLIEEFPNFEIIVGTEQTARGMVNSVIKCDLEESM